MNKQSIINKERIHWADICKGLLIILLMFSHFAWVAQSQCNINNHVIQVIDKYSSIWSCFFMSCFFVLSGMFSNYDKPIAEFLWKKFKTLIFPALMLLVIYNLPSLNFNNFLKKALLYGGGQWFLAALFLSQLLFYVLLNWIKNKKIILMILIIMSFAGVFLDKVDLFPNYWYHRNFLNFCFFLGIGYYYKDFILKKYVGIISAVLYAITISVFFITNRSVPCVVSVFNETLLQHPVTILLSITGSISCIHLCKLIKQNDMLEYLGRISLIIYIYHMLFLTYCIPALFSSLNGGALFNSLIITFMIIVSTLAFSVCVAKFMDIKYFRWMKGDF